MSRRKNDPDWYPALGQARAETALCEAVRDMLRIHDLGERVPESMFELVRERLARVDGYDPSARSAGR